MFRKLRTAGLITAAVAGPYFASETELGQDVFESVRESTGFDSKPVSLSSDQAATVAGDYSNHAHYEVEQLRGLHPSKYRYDKETAQRLGGIPKNPSAQPKLAVLRVEDLRQALRFDITPEWVISRFSRVSTVLADLRLEGLRVPIVTGTRPDDIAGTLTYYFDSSNKLQRLTIHGFTGDPTRLTQTMTSVYGLSREPSLEAGVYTKRWNGHPIHFLRLTHAPVVYSDAVHQKYTVFLELNQPDLTFGVSTEAQRIIAADHGTGRW